MMKPFLATLAATALFLAVPSASAKGFQPGDLRLCNATACARLYDRIVLRKLNHFVYVGIPAPAAKPRLGSAVFRLKLPNGGGIGTIGGAGLDRIRIHGLVCGRFRRGVWYRLPAGVSREARRLTRMMRPLRLGPRVPRSC